MQCCSRTPPFLVPRLRLSVTKSSTAAYAAGGATDAALFVGGIVAILGLYVVYWLGMTLVAMLRPQPTDEALTTGVSRSESN